MNDKFMEGFITPHPDYRPATMWFWNDDLCEEDITMQLEAFKEKGIIDFFINATWGATYEYLGEHFFNMVKYTVEEAERLGLSAWIYDEFNWPSGTVGGMLIRDCPETRGQILKVTKRDLVPNTTIYDLYIKGEFEKAFIVYNDRPQDGAVDVSDEPVIKKNECGFWFNFFNNCCANATLYIVSRQLQDSVEPASRWGKYSFEQPGYIDALNEKAIRKFIEYTHERYKQVIGEHFGKTVKGIFTDEVAEASPHDVAKGRVPWTDDVKEKFFAKYGYDITPWLYALVEKPKTVREKQVRYHLYRLLAEMVEKSHIEQAYTWCDDNDLLYTGHFNGEENMVCAMFQGDLFQMMKWMHVPGIDSIISRYRINDEDFNVTGKIGSSCAKFYNRDRLLCETYTESGYKLRFDEMRRIANRLLTLGVNMLQYMGSFYSMDNARKGSQVAGAPSFNRNNTMFKHFGKLGDYMARVQYLSAKTKPAGRVLVMWTQAEIYANFNVFNGDGDEHNNRYESEMGYVPVTLIGIINALLALNIEYDMFGDSMAAEMTAENGTAKFYGYEYDTVILPTARDTTSGVMAMIEKLKAAGVRVVFVDELPQLAVDTAEYCAPYGADPEGDGLFTVGDNAYLVKVGREEKRRENNEHFKQLLEEAIGEGCRTLDIRHNGDIYCGKRFGEGVTVVFMCNDAAEEREATVAYKDGMKLLDPDTGSIWPLDPVNGRAAIHFDPYQMYVVVEEEEIDLPEEKIEGDVLMTLPDVCNITAEGGNILAARWKHAPYSEDVNKPIVMPENDSFINIFNKRVPGKYSKANAVGLLVFDFEAEILPETVTLFVEYGDVLRCELNGERIDDKWSKCVLWGPKDASVEVAPLLKKGLNRIAMIFRMPDYNVPYYTPFVMLKGEFEVENETICAKRSTYRFDLLNKQGYTDFCGDAAYSFNVNLTAEEAEQAAFLKVETREATELFVNGVSAGVRLWAPQRFNVKGLLKEGENTLSIKTTIPMWNHFNVKEEAMDIGLLSAPKLTVVK